MTDSLKEKISNTVMRETRFSRLIPHHLPFSQPPAPRTYRSQLMFPFRENIQVWAIPRGRFSDDIQHHDELSRTLNADTGDLSRTELLESLAWRYL
jgi:hypothetical protein